MCSTNDNPFSGTFIIYLQTADYSFTKNNPNWDLVLDFRIDVDGGEEVNN